METASLLVFHLVDATIRSDPRGVGVQGIHLPHSCWWCYRSMLLFASSRWDESREVLKWHSILEKFNWESRSR